MTVDQKKKKKALSQAQNMCDEASVCVCVCIKRDATTTTFLQHFFFQKITGS